MLKTLRLRRFLRRPAGASRLRPSSAPNSASSAGMDFHRGFGLAVASSSSVHAHDEWMTETSSIPEMPGIPTVYIDGSRQLKMGTNVAGIGVYWGEDDARNLGRPVSFGVEDDTETSNNDAEMEAAIAALKQARSEGLQRLIVRSDSKFLVQGMSCWIKKWMRTDWKKADGTLVKQRRQFLLLYVLSREMDVTWEHVPGHTGILGNTRADELAKQGSLMDFYRKLESQQSVMDEYE